MLSFYQFKSSTVKTELQVFYSLESARDPMTSGTIPVKSDNLMNSECLESYTLIKFSSKEHDGNLICICGTNSTQNQGNLLLRLIFTSLLQSTNHIRPVICISSN